MVTSKGMVHLLLAFWLSIAGEVIGGCRDQAGGNSEALLPWQAAITAQQQPHPERWRWEGRLDKKMFHQGKLKKNFQ